MLNLDITEVYFLSEAVKTVSVKASDAHTVVALLDKLENEFSKLQAKQEEPQTAEPKTSEKGKKLKKA